jgi:hypothetical protein
VIVSYGEEAQITLYEISDFVDSINIEGAGYRWTTKFEAWLESYALSNIIYALCREEYLASLDLSCINFSDWIVAFKIEDDLFLVYKIIRGSILT